MKVSGSVAPVKFTGEDGEKITIRPSNMGEPYRDGIDFTIESGDQYFGAFLEVYEVKRLYEMLGEYLNIKPEQ
jgi:hypothetical protein